MFYLPALIFATTLTSSLNTADINNLSQICEQIKNNNCLVIEDNNLMEGVEKQLEKRGIHISNWNGCPVVTIKPGFNNGTLPVIPPTDSDNTDSEAPESTEDMEVIVPETTAPGTVEQETEASTESTEGTIAPEETIPEESAPSIIIPPTTEAPTTEAPTTEVPTPEAPTTEAPTTNASYVEQVVNLVNVERAKVGLAALKTQTNITAAAQVRAIEIKQSFSHTRPSGKSFSTALTEKGVTFRGAGENIAWGQRTPEAVVNAWMNSDGHRANILNKNFTSIGVGYFVDSNGTPYWAQLFTY
ncbi:MAG: CAP domain-containing protein [Lachnospiraceae bacterium]